METIARRGAVTKAKHNTAIILDSSPEEPNCSPRCPIRSIPPTVPPVRLIFGNRTECAGEADS